MVSVTVTFTVSEFCLHSGVTRDDLSEIVGLGVVEPRNPQEPEWLFDDLALLRVRRAQRLRQELELDWPGIAVALELMEEVKRLNKENHQLHQRLAQFISHL
ncbi:chaperone modulator CbpM [Shimwellia blattae]|uniref:Chaperone-modulator protein CbpM n=1 Tax=Shimwellia blattae (strain ATCC 29907 / DSM 4481 / JCM 1650 / NBRC 105725 / CDC 9005-74) TaxID=630626 RepID=I2B6T0_SHIBC|nr:chaperone modulator CbpM [Shimwellia blattae]AFJ46234.1 chaperone-modulator protein CbpM [Shimwellia blattae DSM 4481 = NBRC 105725]GAB81128.1 co-chaperone modulatory protein CbpM [Shimwellia blattae DSM 4481 = NBRC 105725]VDY63701.1 Chaperone modulatory protein CbpM [Shimwellia blattae]VEC21835.1 Chaperone modulatory protein CbpM [Shimwellia blattae]